MKEKKPAGQVKQNRALPPPSPPPPLAQSLGPPLLHAFMTYKNSKMRNTQVSPVSICFSVSTTVNCFKTQKGLK